MNLRKWENLLLLLFVLVALSGARTTSVVGVARLVEPPPSSAIEFMTAEELKAKIAKRETVTVIDVRASNDIANSENKIKGAIHVKLRKLKSRLGLPPLSNVSRSSEVVLYC
ncbi:MAG TPA: rhodanese-like domain-containing protein, partial [Pyrinomonadaceae bacterium]|nr:rhodanese-like domain-containing protein [Pyrinomonadaceae bacterium]